MVISIGIAVTRLSWSRFAGALASAKICMVKVFLLQHQESLHPIVSKGPTNAMTNTHERPIVWFSNVFAITVKIPQE